METSPLLFDLGRSKPTTRQIADTVKAGGAEALTDAMKRADAARYQDVICRSALNPVKGMPFSWTLNPYRGCTHGCHYCYARRYHAQFELGAGDEFASVILVKTNFVAVLRRELAKPSWTGELAAMGTATDCYQPIEGTYKITRGALEALCEFRNPTSVVTKGPMIVRDKDVLADLSACTDCHVCVSVPCVDEDVWRSLEPGAAHPMQRLRAVRELVDAGVDAGVLMSPIVPGISSKPSLMERTIKAAADHGARIVAANVMHLDGGTRDHFMRWLEQEYPQLVEGYRELYRGKYADGAYRREVARVVAATTRRLMQNAESSMQTWPTQKKPGEGHTPSTRLATV